MESLKRLFFAVTNDLTSDQRMLRICSTLAAAGYQVHLHGRVLPESRTMTQRNFEQTRMRLWFRKGPLFYIEFNIRLFLYALGEKTDCLSAVDLDTLPAMRLAAWLRNKPLVYDAHEIFTEVPELLHDGPKKRLWQWVEHFFLPGVRYSYTVNHSLAQWYAQKHGIHMHVIRNMPFAAQMHTRQSNEGFILYQGALNAGRGLEALIAAMPQLSMPLYLAGKGDVEAQLRARVVAEGLEKQVFFTGQLDPEALRELTAKAWLGVNLLESQSLNYYYSLANKFFDYAQLGVPQLCMDFPEYSLLNEAHEVAVLTASIDPQHLATQIQQLTSDPERYEQLSRNALVAAKHWTWESEAPKLLALYKDVFLRK
jgi:glycosyltransferase involved in cell wall biosynthesis